jgi:hypothetical protein
VSAAGDVRVFAAQLSGAWRRDATRVAVDQVQRDITVAARRATGGDGRVGDKGALTLKVRATSTGAVVSAVGPWALVERPRRGGYPIRPKQARALRVGPRMWRAGATGGPIHTPARPFAKGVEASRVPARAEVAKLLDQAVSRA